MKRWIGIILTIVIIAGMIGYRIKGKQAEARSQAEAITARQKAAPAVNTASVVQRNVVQKYIGVGSVESPFNIRISSKVTGRIDFLQKREGDRVKAGELLVQIDPTQIKAQVSQAQAAVAEAEARLAQAKLTQNPNNVSVKTQIDQQKAGVASTQADFEQVSQNYAAQVQSARNAVADTQGRIDSAKALSVSATAAIASAQASLDNAKSRFNRTMDLYKQGFVAAQDVDDARTAMKVAEAGLDVAKSQLNSAQAAMDSAKAQKASAEKNEEIVVTKGKADIAAARARLDQSQSGLAFARSGSANIPAYTENLRALSNAIDAAKAQVRNLQSQLADTALSSPIDGYITARLFDPGATVTPGQAIFNVVEIKDLFVSVPVQEEAARHLVTGQSAVVAFDAFPGKVYNAVITQLSPAADPVSRQFPVRVSMANPGGELKPGMFAHVTFVTDTIRQALMVPREAISTTPKGSFVVVVDEANVAHRIPVQRGVDDIADVQIITTAIKPGQSVVTLSVAPIKDAAHVRVNTPGGPPVPPAR